MSIRTYFENIADAIKKVDNSIQSITPEQMPEVIRTFNALPKIKNFQITVIGGYNGNAPIRVFINGENFFTATGNSPYNLQYNPSGGTISGFNGGDVKVTITPPQTTFNTSFLKVGLSGAIIFETEEIYPLGQNQSYGYNYDSGVINV